MGEAALVEGKVADSLRLVQQLDTIGQGPSVALWYFYEDANEWRLLIAGPTFDSLLPKQEAVAYRTLIEAMNPLNLSTLSVSDLKLIETKAPLAQSLRRLISTGNKGLAKAHFTDTTLNNIFIKEMLIMRSS